MGLAEREGEGVCICVCRTKGLLCERDSESMQGTYNSVCDNVQLCVADTNVCVTKVHLCICVRVRRSEGHADRVRS